MDLIHTSYKSTVFLRSPLFTHTKQHLVAFFFLDKKTFGNFPKEIPGVDVLAFSFRQLHFFRTLGPLETPPGTCTSPEVAAALVYREGMCL